MTKVSVLIAGRHATSISLEEEFYEEFLNIAESMKMSRNQLVTYIDKTRTAENLSSAVRVFVLNYYKEKSAAPK
jgi:predicted DNA-binding ribbon-helix-helix protein